MKKRILIMAAGTGGHVFPALAVAKALQAQDIEVAWLGTKKGLENKLLAQTQIPLHQIIVSGVRGHGLRRLLFSPINITRAFIQSMMIIKKFNPDVVLGMGGYVCGPAGIASWLLRKKLVIHEQNAVPGVTNKLLVRFANHVLTGFPNVLQSAKTEYVGNPIRREIADIEPPEARFSTHSGPIKLLVFGGSLGAQSFNEVMPKALSLLPKSLAIDVWHQSGEKGLVIAQKNYRENAISAKITAFIDDMRAAYQWADLVICRSGALTVSEIAAVGLAAIFIPYPFHKDEQQAYNARFLVNAKAAIMVKQAEFIPENIAKLLEKIAGKRDDLLTMAKKGRALREAGATEKIVKVLLDS